MIDPSKNEYIIKMFNDGLYKSYRKKEVTLLRKPLTPEIETVLYTYVGSHKESSSVIKNNSVIARNIIPIDGIYNEWVILYDEAVKIYGKNEIDSLTCEFTPLLKKQIIKAVNYPALKDGASIFYDLKNTFFDGSSDRRNKTLQNCFSLHCRSSANIIHNIKKFIISFGIIRF